MRAYSLALLACLLTTSCSVRHTRQELCSAEQAEVQQREVVQHRASEQTAAEEVVCHEEWGSEGSPTTFRRVRIRRKVHRQGQDSLRYAAQTQQVQHEQRDSKPRGRGFLYLGIGITLAIGTLALLRAAGVSLRVRR